MPEPLTPAEFTRRQVASEREALLRDLARLHELSGYLHADAERGNDVTGDAVNLHQRVADIVRRAARLKGMTETASYFATLEA